MTSPSRSANLQLLAALQGAKNRLAYLTPNDWSLVVDRASQVTFTKNQVLIQQGAPSKILYVIAEGAVNVSIFGTSLARIGPGEICGEMAFLEDTTPSATATADETVQALAVEWKAMLELFELFPHLASRFYRSVAVNLSRRLREQIILNKPRPANQK